MKKLKAYWNRFWHCLSRLIRLDLYHREITVSLSGKTTYIGCECGKHWYNSNPLENEVMLRFMNKWTSPTIRQQEPQQPREAGRRQEEHKKTSR